MVFKQHIYESIMSRLSDIVTIRLNEKFGIYDYDNELLDSECSEISKTIVQKFVADIPNRQKNCRLITYFENQSYDIDLYCISHYMSSVKWLQCLDIYLTGELEDDLSVMLVVDNTVYSVSEDNDYELVKLTRSFELFNNRGIEISPFVMKDGIVQRASIIVNIPHIYKIHTDISSIIRHEIGHIFDLYIKKGDNDALNNDLIELTNPEITNMYCSDETYDIQTIMMNPRIDYSTKYDIMSGALNSYQKMTYDDFRNIVKDNIYMLNESEMHQRLVNFRNELRSIYRNLPKDNDSAKLQRCLSIWSETFGTYFALYQFFKLARKCLPDEIKMKFVNNDVKLVYGHKRDNFKFKYPYTNDFSDNGIYNLKSFDNFVDFHMNRIYENFLKKALSMTIDYIGLNNDDKLHLKTLSHSNSSNQNKYNK